MVVEQLAVAAVVVEGLQCAEVLAVVLQAAARREILRLRAVELADQDVPLLRALAAQADGEGDAVHVLDGEVDVGAGEGAAQVGGHDLHGHGVSSRDGDGVVIAAPGHRVAQLRHHEVQSVLHDLESEKD